MSGYRMTFLAVATLAVSACEQAPEQPPRRQPPQAAPESDPAPAARPPEANERGGLVWDDPGGWEKVLSRSRMRQATYRVPRAKSDREDAEMVVYYFGPNSGGGVEANMKRWRDQFTEVSDEAAEKSTRKVHGLDQHLLSIEKGTFASGMPRGPKTPKKDYGLLAAIVEGPTGAFFFKLTGPSTTVQAERDAFMKLLDSIRAPSP